MIAFFLLLLIVAIALGIVGVVVKGLLYLLIIGIVVFLGALLGAWGYGGPGGVPPGNPLPGSGDGLALPIMLVTFNVMPGMSRPNRVMAPTTRWSRAASTPSGKVGRTMNAAVSFGIPRYC